MPVKYPNGPLHSVEHSHLLTQKTPVCELGEQG